MGLGRAIQLRPVLVGPDYVDLRYGMLFRLRIQRETILKVRPAEAGDAASATVVPPRTEPSLCIELVRSMDAEGLFGVRKRVNRVAVAADDAAELNQALHDLMA